MRLMHCPQQAPSVHQILQPVAQAIQLKVPKSVRIYLFTAHLNS